MLSRGKNLNFCIRRLREAMEAESAYGRQRQHLDKAIASMTAEDKQSLMQQGWRLWNLFPPIQNCPSSEKVTRNSAHWALVAPLQHDVSIC